MLYESGGLDLLFAIAGTLYDPAGYKTLCIHLQ